MTNEEAFKLAMQACKETWNEKTCKQIKEALEQEPCDDTVSIRKDVLKCRVGKLVVYNVEWLKKHWQMEMDIVCGVMPCDDAISRQAVLDGLKGCMCEDWVKTFFATMVKQLPSVTQKSGRWIMSDDGLYRPICDKCGAHPWKGYIPTVEEATEVFKYCPNCGAKMQESEDKK